MNPRKPGEIATKRHQDLLSYLFVNKVSTFKQIHRDQFEGVGQSVVSRHLGRLLRENKIKKGLINASGGLIHVYSIDHGAIGLLEGIQQDQFIQQQLQSASVEHDLRLVDLRKHIRRLPNVISCHSENQIQCLGEYRDTLRFAPFIRLRSDAVVEVSLKWGPTLIPLELELSQKNSARYAEKVAEYYKWPEIRGVLFICGTAAIEKMVSAQDLGQRGERASKFFFAQMQKVLDSNLEIAFTSPTGEKFILK